MAILTALTVLSVQIILVEHFRVGNALKRQFLVAVECVLAEHG